MPRIKINEVEIECREGIPVLQAALEQGLDVPHYCYHPALSVVASCRLCLMEMKMPHPKTGELGWAPKLVPSCQTPVRDGLEVRFDSQKVSDNQERCMEFFLLNHPLDCPVCDQAGECYLQDYSYKFGLGTSRMVDQKHVNPKKDIGPRTLLYQDRCVLCSRCVRFTDEVAGSGELCVVNRGHQAEIDVFPGKVLENPLQGNVVDICPVGCLLDKDFLFKQRVWFLERGASICPGCSTGCAIHIDHNDNRVHRLKPRYNPGVNDWWMCDEGRFGFGTLNDPGRLTRVSLRRGESAENLDWEEVPGVLRFRFRQIAEAEGADKIAAVLSPFLACEEAWMLISTLRAISPEVMLVAGPVPTVEQDQTFPPSSTDGDVKFRIRRERCPNRRGIELLIERFGGPTAAFADFCTEAGKGAFAACWVTGGYPTPWVEKELAAVRKKVSLVVVQDLLASTLSATADIALPMCGFAEREGSFINATGHVQPFAWAVRPPDGCKRDGQYLYELAALELDGFAGLYSAARVREKMAQTIAEFGDVWVPPPVPDHQH